MARWKSWGDAFNSQLRRGFDHGYAAFAADNWARRQKEKAMTGIKTARLDISVDAAVADMLAAFAAARNGSIHNVASEMLRRGIENGLREAPAVFRVRYEAALKGSRGSEEQ